jgi:hypothetical protein
MKTTKATKQHDVELILKLYELRREKRMRRARAWYFTKFNPTSAADIGRLFAGGERASAYYRMVTSYWDMAASFVINGGIDEKLFVAANTEYIGVFAKLEPFIAELREAAGEPDYLLHLEQLVRRTPNAEAVMERRRKIFARWAKSNKRKPVAEAGDAASVATNEQAAAEG